MILDSLVFSGERPIAGLMLVAFIIFSILAFAYVMLRESLNDKRKAVRSAGSVELEMPATTARLLEEKQFDPVPTVTESTTNLLPTEKNR